MRQLIFFLFLFLCTSSTGQIITTFAGNGSYGYSGDGGPAINAQLADMYYTYPAFDNFGNMYIAQNSNNTIRKIDISGTITTIAGKNGVIGYSGDGGPATNALLYHPTSIAIDNNNNIYFADANGNFIRKIDPAGIITTVSGQATTNCGVGEGGNLALAKFQAISAMTFDQFNNLYIADFGCNTIRKVNALGIITTVAGNGTLGFSGDGGPATQARLAYPCKVAVDNAGNIYIPDAQNHRIRKVSTTGIITTIAGTGVQGYSGDGGPAINAKIAFPGSVVIDNTNNLYFGDYNNVIRKIDLSGNITTYGGNGVYGYSGDGGPAVLASIGLSEGKISIYNNNIFFVNYIPGGPGNTIRKISNCLTASITQQPANVTLCNSGNATFGVNASNTSAFQWQFNNGLGWTNLTDNSIYSGSITNTMLITGASTSMNNYQYRCMLSNGCGSIFSTTALLLVNTLANPSIIVNTSSTNICSGTSVLFTASVQNGGSSPNYQWKKNGISVGSNSNTYSDNTLVNGDIINCTLTSNAACTVGSTVNSNFILMNVTTSLSPSVAISASANNICFGTPVTFTTSIVNGGLTPIFAWFKNGINLSLNSPTYTDNSLNNGDKITCSVTSSLSCVTASTSTSSPIIMTILPLASPSVVITSSANSVCRNTTVTFTASAVDGGNMPVYQWVKNGVPVGTNSNVYSENSLSNGDVITCTLTSSANCASSIPQRSNPLRISIYPDPLVFLDKTNSLCEGSTKILDAGSFSAYKWQDNSTSRYFSISGIGKYFVQVTDANNCLGSDTVVINKLLSAPYNFLPKDSIICSYDFINIIPLSNFNSYLWNTNAVTSTIRVSNPGSYWLKVIDKNGCTGNDTIKITTKECRVSIFIPTAFTPNHDGKNDIFKPITFGPISDYLFTIYNRFGEIVFSTVDVNKGWDGRFKSIAQENNTFVWTCIYKLNGGELTMQKGTVTLIK